MKFYFNFCFSSLSVHLLLMLSMVSLSFVPSSCIGDEVCSWSNISIVFKKQSKAQTLSSKQGNLDRGRRGQKTTTPILSLPRGAIRTGRLTAVMGPSGSGKSTFLNIISERFHNSSSLTSYRYVGCCIVSQSYLTMKSFPNFIPIQRCATSKRSHVWSRIFEAIDRLHSSGRCLLFYADR